METFKQQKFKHNIQLTFSLTETSESNTVPTQSSVITEEILAEATTADDIGFVDKKISTAENPTEIPESTTANFHPPTEEQQLEMTNSNDQTTQPNLLSTPEMSTISKELAPTGMYQNIHFHSRFIKWELFLSLDVF